MLNFYDFEVFKYDWLVVIIDPTSQTKTIIINDKEKLEAYYEEHKREIWLGYNSRNYDQYILKSILCGFDPKKVNDFIIVRKRKGYEFSRLFNNFPLYDFDVMNRLEGGLKSLEGFMGNNIKETSVPFDINRPLTEEEIQETVKYCTHDVEQTIEVFLQKKADFDAQVDVIKTFNLPLSNIGKTQAQLTALALGCKRQKHNDEWDISFVDTIKLDKYKNVWEWFKDPNNYIENSLKVNVAGIPHTFGLGGIHGASDKPIHAKGLIVHVDVTSYYPSLMIEYDLLSRNVKDKTVFKDIYDKRVALKKAGKKKEQAPYKIILNSTFGITNDVYSLAYDPRRNHEVCINGQLLLLDLIEKLENHCTLIQSNTDGLIIQIPNTDEAFDKIDDICYEWEQRTRMSLGFDIITEIWQKDVNNYVFKFENGEIERKGAYVKELTPLNYDLPIVNKAVVRYMTEGVLPEITIGACNDLKEFQKIVKISSKYMCGWHNGERLTDKCFRVFASTDVTDTYVGKQKKEGATIEKFANTPDHCFIWNESVNDCEVPSNLDKQWYIDLAHKRLADFGITP